MKSDQELTFALKVGLSALRLDIPSEPLLKYLYLLHQWNHAYNLTAIRDLDAMIPRHLLDSLAILKWIKGERVLDVGTGPGLPGIPVALANPALHVVLLDSNGKKIRFLNEVKRVLSIDNIDIIQSRVESYRPLQRFDTVLSRAFSTIEQMMLWTKHLIAPEGIWLAMKGRTPEMELSSIHSSFRLETYVVSGMDAERCCVIVENKE